MDYSIRLPSTSERREILESKCDGKKQLLKLKDTMLKPVGVSLRDFDIKRMCVRLREFIEEDKDSTLVRLVTVETAEGYTDEREDLGKGSKDELLKVAKSLGLEAYGEIEINSTEYDFNFGGWVKVLFQELKPMGKFIKVETESEEGMKEMKRLLKATDEEIIKRNSAVLLAEKLCLI